MIYTADIDIPTDFCENIIRLRGVVEQVKKSNQGGWQSELIAYKTYAWAHAVLDQVKSIVNQKELTYWFNINGPGHYNEWHDHARGTAGEWCACLYIHTPEGSGNIQFKTEEYKPRPGLLVVFPDTAQHQVLPNTSDQERISLAFNFWKMIK